MSYSPLPTNPFGGAGGPQQAGQPQQQGQLGMFSSGSWQVPRLRVAGEAPVYIHWSTIILVGFIGLLSWGYTAALSSTVVRLVVALLSAFVLVLSIFAHELGHAYAYHRIYGVWVVGIYLYAMGGFTAATPDSGAMQRKSMMIVVAVAGPLINAVLAGMFLGLFYGLLAGGVALDPLVYTLLFMHGWMQVVLAVYNMIPGVPLDGSNFLVGFLRLCLNDIKSKQVGYSIGLVIIVVAVVLTAIFYSFFAAFFLVMVLLYTGFALYDVLQRPKSVTNPTY